MFTDYWRHELAKGPTRCGQILSWALRWTDSDQQRLLSMGLLVAETDFLLGATDNARELLAAFDRLAARAAKRADLPSRRPPGFANTP